MQGNESPPSMQRVQYSLRWLFMLTLLCGLALSGLFANPCSLAFAAVGVVLVGVSLCLRGKIALFGVAVGLGYLGMGAVFFQLLSLP